MNGVIKTSKLCFAVFLSKVDDPEMFVESTRLDGVVECQIQDLDCCTCILPERGEIENHRLYKDQIKLPYHEFQGVVDQESKRKEDMAIKGARNYTRMDSNNLDLGLAQHIGQLAKIEIGIKLRICI